MQSCIRFIFLCLGLSCARELSLSPQYNLTWQTTAQRIDFTVRVSTRGWVGLGFSKNGGMAGSDIIIAWIDSNGRAYIEDRYANASGLPSLDDSQDVTLVAGKEEKGITTITFSRGLKNCDKRHDYTITADTTKLIYAFGAEDPINNTLQFSDYHGQTSRGVRSVYLLDTADPVTLPANIRAYNFTSKTEVPKDSTTYYCTFHSGPNITVKHHVIASEPVIQAGNEALVHHIIIYGCWGVNFNDVQSYNTTGGVCYSPSMPVFVNKCRSPVFSWAIGGMMFYFPPHTGFPIGDAEAPSYYMVETHYNNPELVEGRFDTSGIRVYYTPTLRKHDTGVLYSGAVMGLFVPPRTEEFKVHSYCSSECTREWIPQGGIKVISYFLHSHHLGKAMKIHLYRDGKELKPLASDDHYDFNYQETRLLNEEVLLLPGDSLSVTCTMDSTNRISVTYGGFPSTSEMCLALLSYYPRQNISICDSTPDYLHQSNSTLWKELNAPIRAVSPEMINMEEILDNITWSKQNIERAQKAISGASHRASCFKMLDHPLQNDGQQIFPFTGDAYVETERGTCMISASACLQQSMVLDVIIAVVTYWLRA